MSYHALSTEEVVGNTTATAIHIAFDFYGRSSDSQVCKRHSVILCCNCFVLNSTDVYKGVTACINRIVLFIFSTLIFIHSSQITTTIDIARYMGTLDNFLYFCNRTWNISIFNDCAICVINILITIIYKSAASYISFSFQDSYLILCSYIHGGTTVDFALIASAIDITDGAYFFVNGNGSRRGSLIISDIRFRLYILLGDLCVHPVVKGIESGNNSFTGSYRCSGVVQCHITVWNLITTISSRKCVVMTSPSTFYHVDIDFRVAIYHGSPTSAIDIVDAGGRLDIDSDFTSGHTCA